jgi:hypothetical protein
VEELQRLYNLPVLLALSFALQEVHIWFGSSLKRQGERTRFLLLFPQSCKPHRPCPLSTPTLLLKKSWDIEIYVPIWDELKKTLTLKAKHKTKGLGIVTLILLRQKLLLI